VEVPTLFAERQPTGFPNPGDGELSGALDRDSGVGSISITLISAGVAPRII
jgi:hypothetical protein